MRRFLSRGSTEIYILLVVIVGAFLLSGGQFLLKNIVPDNANGTNGANGGNGGNSSSDNGNNGNPGNPGDWSIEQILAKASCDSAAQTSQVELAFHGTATGFYRIDIKNGDAYQPVFINNAVYNPFNPNSQNIQANDLSFSNSDGFNTKSWRAVLFQGGTVSGNDLTGGAQRAEKEFPATGCQ